MTVKEQREAIEKYCDDRPLCSFTHRGRDECPLLNHPSARPLAKCADAPDEVIPELYKLIFGAFTPDQPDQPDPEANPTHDPVNHPSHYTQGGMECIDEMLLIFGKEAVKHFCLCNAWKYRKRALFKNGQEDIDKSDWYIAKYKELEGA